MAASALRPTLATTWPSSSTSGSPESTAAVCRVGTASSPTASSSASASTTAAGLPSVAAGASPLPLFFGRRRLRVASSFVPSAAGAGVSAGGSRAVKGAVGASASGVGVRGSAASAATAGGGRTAGAASPATAGQPALAVTSLLCGGNCCVFRDRVEPDAPLAAGGVDASRVGTKLRAELMMPTILPEAPDAASVTRAAAPLAFSLKPFK
mmetsp:Transcript_131054/g.365235  ORF Transcript_131054/g.365235 Transcript_131054/m.365235 type:complete len:210 (-) Transcript_131054:626-1255(-)